MTQSDKEALGATLARFILFSPGLLAGNTSYPEQSPVVPLPYEHVVPLSHLTSSQTASNTTSLLHREREVGKRLEARFAELADQWRSETLFVSSISDLISNHAYRAIIELGEAVVPLILHELGTRQDFWFPALGKITGACPVNPGAAGDVEQMSSSWLAWGKEHGYI